MQLPGTNPEQSRIEGSTITWIRDQVRLESYRGDSQGLIYVSRVWV